MTKLWRGEYSQDGKRDLQEIESCALEINKPTVIFFSGFSTTNANKGCIAGALKRLEVMFGLGRKNNENMTLVSGSYKGLSQIFNAIIYNCFPKQYFSNPAKKMARDILLPLVADNIKLDEKRRFQSADKIDLDEARRRLRNVTLMGYSMGTVLTQEMYNATAHFMKKMGYSKEEIKSLLDEVVLLSIGTISRPSKERGRFKTIYLVASNDDVVQKKNVLWISPNEIFWRRWRGKELNIHKIAHNTLYISAPVNREMIETKVNNDGTVDQKKIGLLYPSKLGFYSHHELPHYITQNDDQNPFAKIATFILVNAIHRQGNVDVLDLIQPGARSTTVAFHPSEEEIRKYKERLQRAYRGGLQKNKATPSTPA